MEITISLEQLFIIVLLLVITFLLLRQNHPHVLGLPRRDTNELQSVDRPLSPRPRPITSSNDGHSHSHGPYGSHMYAESIVMRHEPVAMFLRSFFYPGTVHRVEPPWRAYFDPQTVYKTEPSWVPRVVFEREPTGKFPRDLLGRLEYNVSGEVHWMGRVTLRHGDTYVLNLYMELHNPNASSDMIRGQIKFGNGFILREPRRGFEFKNVLALSPASTQEAVRVWPQFFKETVGEFLRLGKILNSVKDAKGAKDDKEAKDGKPGPGPAGPSPGPGLGAGPGSGLNSGGPKGLGGKGSGGGSDPFFDRPWFEEDKPSPDKPKQPDTNPNANLERGDLLEAKRLAPLEDRQLIQQIKQEKRVNDAARQAHDGRRRRRGHNNNPARASSHRPTVPSVVDGLTPFGHFLRGQEYVEPDAASDRVETLSMLCTFLEQQGHEIQATQQPRTAIFAVDRTLGVLTPATPPPALLSTDGSTSIAPSVGALRVIGGFALNAAVGAAPPVPPSGRLDPVVASAAVAKVAVDAPMAGTGEEKSPPTPAIGKEPAPVFNDQQPGRPVKPCKLNVSISIGSRTSETDFHAVVTLAEKLIPFSRKDAAMEYLTRLNLNCPLGDTAEFSFQCKTPLVGVPENEEVALLGPIVDYAIRYTAWSMGAFESVMNGQPAEEAVKAYQQRSVTSFLPSVRSSKPSFNKDRHLLKDLGLANEKGAVPPVGHEAGGGENNIRRGFFDGTAINRDVTEVKSIFIERKLITLDRTNLNNRLGHGGFGSVWRGVYIGSTVAVKEVANRDREQRKIIENEIRTISLAKFPWIVNFYGVSQEDLPDNKSVLLVMEYCPMGNLRDVIDREILNKNQMKSLDWTRRKTMAKQLCLAVRFLHTRNIVHSDLKPQNILVAESWDIKVCDFGLAKELEEKKNFQSFAMGRTRAYESPEAARSEKCSFPSDIFSLGLVLFELMTLRDMTEEFANEDLKIFEFNRGRGGSLPDVTGLPAAASNLLVQCWQADPHQRATLDQIIPAIEELRLSE